jgi:hypothetical protein
LLNIRFSFLEYGMGTKWTYFFADNRFSAGWTESHYSTTTPVAAALPIAAQLGVLRRAWLVNYCKIVALRVQNTANLFDSVLTRQTSANGLGNLVPTDLGTIPAAAIQIALYPGVGNPNPAHGRLFARGIDGTQCVQDASGTVTLQPPLSTAIVPWVNAMIAGTGLTGGQQMCNYVEDPTIGKEFFQGTLTGVGARGYVFEQTDGLPLEVEDRIRVARVPGTYGVAGSKVVTGVSGTTIGVGGATPVGVTDQQIRGTQYTPELSLIGALVFETLTERKTGRIFGVELGRRPNDLPLRR